MSGGVEGVALLPCPFCGGEATLTGFKAPEFWVRCYQIGCKASTEASGSKSRAITAWNTRTTPPAGSYADGIADAARAADDYALGALEGGEPLIEATAETIAAAIRLLSQGEKA